MDKPRTICVKCKHVLYRECYDESDFYPEWCEASPLIPTYNPLTGDKTNCKFESCKKINDGNCKLYEPKPPKIKSTNLFVRILRKIFK